MRTAFVSLVLAFALGSAFSTGHAGQQDKKDPAPKMPPLPAWAVPPQFSAFPEFRLDKLEDVQKLHAKLKANFPRPIPANGTPLQKVRTAQVNEGVAAVLMSFQMIENGNYRPEEFRPFMDMASDTFRVLAELEGTSASRIAAAETRVLLVNDVERFIQARVNSGADHSRSLNVVRFARLQAEADLILLKEQLAKEKK